MDANQREEHALEQAELLRLRALRALSRAQDAVVFYTFTGGGNMAPFPGYAATAYPGAFVVSPYFQALETVSPGPVELVKGAHGHALVLCVTFDAVAGSGLAGRKVVVQRQFRYRDEHAWLFEAGAVEDMKFERYRIADLADADPADPRYFNELQIVLDPALIVMPPGAGRMSTADTTLSLAESALDRVLMANRGYRDGWPVLDSKTVEALTGKKP